MESVLFILYVKDQVSSRNFYSSLLNSIPTLDVPGITEFDLMNGVKLGLMPEKNIAKLISPPLPYPSTGNGIPRCEVYLQVVNPMEYINRGLAAGAKMVNEFNIRDWGDKAGYISDLDGNVIVFAEKH